MDENEKQSTAEQSPSSRRSTRNEPPTIADALGILTSALSVCQSAGLPIMLAVETGGRAVIVMPADIILDGDRLVQKQAVTQ